MERLWSTKGLGGGAWVGYIVENSGLKKGQGISRKGGRTLERQ